MLLRRLRRIPRLAALSGVATGVALLLSVSVLVSTNGLAVRDCRQIELVKTRIRTVIGQQTRTLGRPGSAGYGYFLAHPAELSEALRQARQALGTFAASRCG